MTSTDPRTTRRRAASVSDAETLDGMSTVEPTSVLHCRFLVRPERIRVHAEVEAAKADTVLSTDTFGWRVLQTLADEVEVLHEAATEGRRATVGIRLDKSAGDVPR